MRWLNHAQLLQVLDEMPLRPMRAGEDGLRLSLAGAQDKQPVALGVVSEHKYQNEGGPSLAQAFALLRSATRPSAPHTLKLLDNVVFNALIGNHDAHGKNFSLLYTPAGAVLTPLYDALCTAIYPTLSDKMAMKIGSKYKFSDVQARAWAQFAAEAALSPAQVKKTDSGHRKTPACSSACNP